MNIRISHCAVCWGYRGRAHALAEELRRRFGAKVDVVEGTLGQFDVHVDGDLVVSRGESLLSRIKPPRIPNSSVVIAAIERRLPAGQGNLHRVKDDRNPREFGPTEAKRFYDWFGAKQDSQWYEKAALDHLVAHADFERASAVFELGCGTGRLAEGLFESHFAANVTYVGMDVSATMIKLATRRLLRWTDRATLRQADGAQNLPYADAAFDRFVATYVLDLLPEHAIHDVMSEAHRLLRREGKLCVVTSTEGLNAISRVICSVWKGVYKFSPRLVGGCRPLRVSTILDKTVWRISTCKPSLHGVSAQRSSSLPRHDSDERVRGGEFRPIDHDCNGPPRQMRICFNMDGSWSRVRAASDLNSTNPCLRWWQIVGYSARRDLTHASLLVPNRTFSIARQRCEADKQRSARVLTEFLPGVFHCF